MWVKVDDGFPLHPKVFAASRHLGETSQIDRVIGFWLIGLCLANRSLNDGSLSSRCIRALRNYDRSPLAVADALVAGGLWERVPEGYVIHDYADYQPRAADVKARKLERRKYPGFPHVENLPPGPIPEDQDQPTEDHGAARRLQTRPRPVVRYDVLTALVWLEVKAAARAGSLEAFAVTEQIKRLAAQCGIAYNDPAWLAREIDRAMTAARRPTSGARISR